MSSSEVGHPPNLALVLRASGFGLFGPPSCRFNPGGFHSIPFGGSFRFGGGEHCLGFFALGYSSGPGFGYFRFSFDGSNGGAARNPVLTAPQG